MSQKNLSREQNIQENFVKDNIVSRDLIFAPIQAEQYIETQIIEISAEKITQKPLIKASPYKGLKRFNFRDREYFFGRDALIAKLLKAVNKSSFSLVLGASGSGKSSVIRAGLIPELKNSLESQKFYDFIFTPHQNPFESLYRCLLKEDKDYQFSESEAKVALEAKPNTLSQIISTLKKKEERWLIFIDQFEQLFTVCTNLEQRKNFIEGIVRAAKKGDSSIRIILAMRSDFLEQFSFYPSLGAIADQNNMHLVTEMYSDELRQAIEQPAAKNGVVFEKGLVEQIIKEVEGQSGYLPLLQYTLDLLWQRECLTKAADGRLHIEARTLNKTSYAALGGVRGALQKRVDEIYKDVCEKNQDGELVTKQIFLKLVNIVDPDSGSRAVSQRAYRYEFVGEPVESNLKRFIDENLLVSSYEYSSEEKLSVENSKKSIERATIEIAHEILLSSWDRLKRWLEDEKEAIILKNWLAGETRRWLEVRAKDESKALDELLKGSRLNQIVEFRDKNAFEKCGGLVIQEEEFIDASVEWHKFVQAEKERVQKEKTRLQRRAIKWLSGGLTVALIAAGVAGWQWQRTEKQRQIALSRELAAQAELTQNQRAYLLQRSALLAVETIQRFSSPAPGIDQTLRQALDLLPFPIARMRHKSIVVSADFSPDGKYLATASWDNTARVWEVSSKREIQRFAHEDSLSTVVFSPDGKYLATASWDNTARVWEVNSGREIQRFAHEDDLSTAVFSPDGKYVATASDDNTAKVWEVNSGREIQRFAHEDNLSTVVFSPDGKYLATASDDNTARVWEVASGREVARMSHMNEVNSITFSPNGKFIATASKDRTTKVWLWKTSDLIAEICNRLTRNLTFQEWKSYLGNEPYSKTCPNRSIHFSYINAGRKLAREDNIKEARAIFRRASELEPKLELDPEKEIKKIQDEKLAKTLVEEGQELVITGDIEGAIAKFQQAGKLDPSLNIDSETIIKEQVVEILTNKVRELFAAGDIENASTSARRLVEFGRKLDSKLDVDPEKLISLMTREAGKNFLDQGNKQIKIGDIEGAIASFRKSVELLLKLDPKLNVDPEKTPIRWVAQELIKRGDDLESVSIKLPKKTALALKEELMQILFDRGNEQVKEDNIKGAITSFHKAVELSLQLDPKQNFDPQQAAIELTLNSFNQKVVGLIKQGKLKEAKTTHAKAIKVVPEIAANSWNSLCWNGSVYGYADDFIDACKNAVSLAPENGQIRDSRGLNNGLTGNIEGAIEDFQAFIDWVNNNKELTDENKVEFNKLKFKRQRWLDDLRLGNNPFTPEELEQLRNE